MKHLLTASMIAIGMLAAAPLAPAYAASAKHPITHTHVNADRNPARGTTSHIRARGAASRAGYEAYGYAPSAAYPGYTARGAAYPDGARSSYEEKLIQTTEQDTY